MPKKKNRGNLKFRNISKGVKDGRYGFKALFKAATGQVWDMGFFTTDTAAAKAADLARLASGISGSLNFRSSLYSAAAIKAEAERLMQLGALPKPPAANHGQQRHTVSATAPANTPVRKLKKKAKQSGASNAAQGHGPGTIKAATSQAAAAASAITSATASRASTLPEPQPATSKAAGAEQGRKRKADITTVAPVTCDTAASGQSLPAKRAKTSHDISTTMAAEEPASAPAAGKPQKQVKAAVRAAAAAAAGAAASQPGPLATGLALMPALPQQHLLPTGGAVQHVAGSAGREAMLQQVRSALAAHEASKRQLRAALDALEASEGQLIAVARAAGLL